MIENKPLPLEYRPNWPVVGALLFLIAINSLQYGYVLGTWNRVHTILEAKFKFTKEDISFYETFITNTPVAGMMIGRLLGSFYVNHGRFQCILLGAALQIVGIGCCLIFSV